MSDPRELRIEDYSYELPDERIARYPLEERDASKLLIYKEGQIQEDIYRNIASHIPQGALMVFNQTKVVHARLLFKKETGGVIEVFCLEPHEQYADIQTAMQQTGSVLWKCMIGGASKWKHGMTPTIQVPEKSYELSARIIDRNSGTFTIEMAWNANITFAEVLHDAGKVPLPPYLNRDAQVSDETRYQTVYAKDEGSVAAPTAGLHFTPQVLDSLAEKGVDTAFVTLHVGAGTFKPVKSETMQDHDMHAEWIETDAALLQQLIDHLDKGIVAVGTTSMRTLESFYWIGVKLIKGFDIDFSGIAVSQWDPYDIDSKIPSKEALKAIAQHIGNNRLVTRTQIIIAPKYQFRIVKGLVTNFHQPQSTLLLLVAAMAGKDWKEIYCYAMANAFRFLSYGDGSLIWR